MIEAQNVTVRAGRRALLDGVSCALHPGTVTAVLGPNGAGKTTLLRVLSGMARPTSGEVLLDGAPLHTMDRAALARRRAVLGQHQALEFGLLVEDVVALGRLPHAGTALARGNHTAIAAARDRFGLGAMWHRPYPTLSGGERQRVQLARIAAQLWRSPDTGDAATRLLFLDEPTAALDLSQQGAALAFARQLANEGAAVLAVLHDLNQATMADQAILLQAGRLVAVGKTATIMQPNILRACFGVDIEAVARGDGRQAFLVS